MHSILEWNRDQELYVLAISDYKNNDGGVLLTDNNIKKVLKTVGKALKYMHGLGIAHGMVDPSNIQIDSTGKVLLTGLLNKYSDAQDEATDEYGLSVRQQNLTDLSKETLSKDFIPPEARS